MLPLEALSAMRVMIATPCLGGTTTAGYSTSLFQLSAQAAKIGMDLSLETRADSSITRSRNRLVARFLVDKSRTHLFFIDGDIGFKAEAFARSLLADRDVVAGAYPLKRYNWPEKIPEAMTPAQFAARYVQYPFNPIDEKLTADAEGFAKVGEAPTGFMCIKRSAIEKMMVEYPDMRLCPDDRRPDETGDVHWEFFSDLVVPGNGGRRDVSEDYGFCHRWRGIGGDVWIDLASTLSHYGNHVWHGDLLAHLKMKG